MKKKVMMFNPGEICYGSLVGFMHLIEKTLNELGYETVIHNITTLDALMSEAGNCCALVMLNGNTSVKVGDEYVLDMLGIPIIDFIVDHPRHHQVYLSTPLKNLYVVCLDEDQVMYIQKYFPHVRGAMAAWLYGGVYGKMLSFEERDLGILFSGSYVEPQKYVNELQKRGDEIAGLGAEAIEMLLENNSLLIEQALSNVYAHHGLDVDDALFSELDGGIGMYVDFFMRQYYRLLLVEGLVRKGVPVTLCGGGWERTNLQSELVTIIPSVPFDQTPEIITRARVSLSINPWFKKGLHDRVITSMMNHTVCATDPSESIIRNFRDGDDIILYDLNNPSEIAERLVELANDKDEWERVSENGYRAVMTKYDFHDVVSGIMDMIAQ